ncbi:MAG: hypothetical protein ACRDTC_24345 [Pseudonocardiaceae bacterium]
MSDVVGFTEIRGQHVELLPARTVLSGLLSNVLQNRPGADGGTFIGGSTIDRDTVDLNGDGIDDRGFGGGGGRR